MNQPLVSVLILTYNRSDLLKSCLQTVLRSTYPELEFVVCDNGSSEHIKEFVKKTFPKVKIKIVRLEKNKGLTGGFNYGYQFCKGKYVMVLSNDTKLDKKAITYMVDMMEKDEKIGVISPKIIQMQHPKELHNVGSFFTYTGLLYHYGICKSKNDQLYQAPYYIMSANGAGFLARKHVIDRIGFFDDDFFVYYDESDFCHRVWIAGYTIVYCPKAELLHLWGATINVDNPEIWLLNDRNKLTSFIKNLSFPNLLIVFTTFNLLLIVWFFTNLLKGRFTIAWNLPKVYFWHSMHIRQTLQKRKAVQALRRASDKEIFARCLLHPKLNYYYLLYKFGVVNGLRKYRDEKLPEGVYYQKSA